jgi:agmatinase
MALEDAKNEVDRAISGEKTGLGYENVFAGVPSFLRRAYAKDVTGFDLAVTGIPFDQAVTHRPGARFGPRAIREASTMMAGDVPYGWGYDPLGRFAVADAGDMALDYARASETPERIEVHISNILATGAACITLGGDHSIALPSLRAHAEKYGPLGLLQFDAHPDTWTDDDLGRVDHGTFVYKAIREGLLDPARIAQIGTRVEVEGEDDFPITRIDAREVHGDGIHAAVTRARAALGEGPVYVSFDIDVLDPAFAPGTGTPVWGGLSTSQIGLLLRGFAGIDMVGGDVVEVSPPYDHAGITALAGAHVAYDLIALWGWTRR